LDSSPDSSTISLVLPHYINLQSEVFHLLHIARQTDRQTDGKTDKRHTERQTDMTKTIACFAVLSK